MVEAQKDPMEPPKFKTNTKIPRGPPSPPAPVLHSPTRKVCVCVCVPVLTHNTCYSVLVLLRSQ